MAEGGTSTPTAESSGKEQESLKAVSKLYLVVHPSFLVGTNEGENAVAPETVEAYDQKSTETARHLINRFSDINEDEFVLFIPPEEPSLDSWRIAKRTEDTQTHWTSIYKTLKRSSAYPKNIFVIDDILYSKHLLWKNREERLEEGVTKVLRKNGFKITAQTEVVLGGEFRDVCVLDVTFMLAEGTSVRKLKIDKRASLTSAYDYRWFRGKRLPEDMEAEVNTHLTKHLSFQGNVSEDDDYFYLEK